MKKGAKGVILGIMVVSFCLAWSNLCGFDEKQVQKFKKTNSCQKCDLSGAKLGGLDLTYADLVSANLSGADLSNSVLTSANLAKANLSGSNLSGVNLWEANLKGADLSKANLTKAYLDKAVWTDGRTCKIGSIGQCK